MTKALWVPALTLVGMCIVSSMLSPHGACAEPVEPKVYGVFVGDGNCNLTFINKDVTDLRYSDNNAYDMEKKFLQWGWVDESYLLISPDAGDVGGEIPPSAISHNASWKSIEDVLFQIKRNITVNDFLFFYYNGNANRGAINVQNGTNATYINVDYFTLFAYLDLVKTKATAIIIDASFASSIQRDQASAAGMYITMASCRDDQLSYEGAAWNGSVFTCRLLEHYQSKNGICSITDGFDGVAEQVRTEGDYQISSKAMSKNLDFTMDLRNRLIKPAFEISFTKEDSEPVKNYVLSAYPDEKKSITVTLYVTNSGTADAMDVYITLVDDHNLRLGTTNLTNLSYGDSSEVNITIILNAGQSTGLMSANVSSFYNGEECKGFSNYLESAVATVNVISDDRSDFIRTLLIYIDTTALGVLIVVAIAMAFIRTGSNKTATPASSAVPVAAHLAAGGVSKASPRTVKPGTTKAPVKDHCISCFEPLKPTIKFCPKCGKKRI